ncbi:hypothetical protein BD410DRAFT_825445 [Rickenella mellea]|uniref:Uncharacterized protein n=1 Tax=Rickenella mellea TaxID=50990 RepID=A0A4Y7QH92_9AGAM|nr:hypothetical protein BD410DRAFT_825445 [Rickenella mellea]
MRVTRSKARNSRSPLPSGGSAESSNAQFPKLLNSGKKAMREGVSDARPRKLAALSVEVPNPTTAPTRQKVVDSGGYHDTRVFRARNALPHTTIEPSNASGAMQVPTAPILRQNVDTIVNGSTAPITERQCYEESRADSNARKNIDSPAMPPPSAMAGGAKLERAKTQPVVEHASAFPTKRRFPVRGTTLIGGARPTTGNPWVNDKENANKFVGNDVPGSSSKTNGASTSTNASTPTNTAPPMTLGTLTEVRKTFKIWVEVLDKTRTSLAACVGNAMVQRTLVNAQRASFIQNVGEIYEEFACRDGKGFLKAIGSSENKVDVEDAPMLNTTGKAQVTAEQRAALALLVSQGIKIRDFAWPKDDPRHLGTTSKTGKPEFRKLVLGNALKKAERAAKPVDADRTDKVGSSNNAKAGTSKSTSVKTRPAKTSTSAAPTPTVALDPNGACPRIPIFAPPPDLRTPGGPSLTLEEFAEMCQPVSLQLTPVFTAPPPHVPSSSILNNATLSIHRPVNAVDTPQEMDVEMEKPEMETETVSDASSWTTYTITPPIAGPSRKRVAGGYEDDDGWTTSEYEASPKRVRVDHQPEEKNRKRKERAHYDDDTVSSSAVDEQPPVKRLKHSNGPYDAQGHLGYSVPVPVAVSSISQNLAAPRGVGRSDGQSLARMYGRKWPPSPPPRNISDLDATTSISALGGSAVDVTAQ